MYSIFSVTKQRRWKSNNNNKEVENKVTLYGQIERNNNNCLKKSKELCCKRGSWLLLLYFHVPNTSFNESQHDFNSTNNFTMSSDFKIRTIFISNFLLDFWEGDIFTLQNFSSCFFFHFCSHYCSAVRTFFPSLSTNCLFAPNFLGIFMKVYKGRQAKTQKLYSLHWF